MTDQRPAYVSLVAALRMEFTPPELQALLSKLILWQKMEGEGGQFEAQDVLTGAFRSALDPSFDGGGAVHPAVRAWLTTGSGRADR